MFMNTTPCWTIAAPAAAARSQAASRLAHDPSGKSRKAAPRLESSLKRPHRFSTRLIKAYKDTRYADLARRDRDIPLGLKWQATGGTKTIVHVTLAGGKYDLDPLKSGQEVSALRQPAGSGGLLMALYLYRRFLILGPTGLKGSSSRRFTSLFILHPPTAKRLRISRTCGVDTEVMLTEHAAVSTKWYFSLKDQTLLASKLPWIRRAIPARSISRTIARWKDGCFLPNGRAIRQRAVRGIGGKAPIS